MSTHSRSRAYGQYCPVAKSLDVIGDRWTLLIVRDLMRGKRRFKDLQESLSGIAPNLLSDRLKKLESAGLIVRTLFRQIPPKVEYTLTDKGRTLDTVLASLMRWGMAHAMGSPSRDENVDPELIFQAMPAVFIKSAAKGVDAVYKVEVSGATGGTWFVHITARGCKVSTEPPKEPKVTIKTDAKTWVRLATGGLEPQEAEQLGKLHVEGDRALADRFAGFFITPSSVDSQTA